MGWSWSNSTRSSALTSTHREIAALHEKSGRKSAAGRTATSVVAHIVAAVAAAVTARGAVSQMRGHVRGLAPAVARGREGRQPRVSGRRSDVAVAVTNSFTRAPPPDDVRTGIARGRVVRGRETSLSAHDPEEAPPPPLLPPPPPPPPAIGGGRSPASSAQFPDIVVVSVRVRRCRRRKVGRASLRDESGAWTRLT